MPGNASGGMDGIAVKPLTVSFSEPGFLSKANQENQFGPWFTLSDKERQQLGSPMGPVNPQALNRYAYVLNNPVRYIDPSGHSVYMSQLEADAFSKILQDIASAILVMDGGVTGHIVAELIMSIVTKQAAAGIIGAVAAAGLSGLAIAFAALVVVDAFFIARTLDQFSRYIDLMNGPNGVIIASECQFFGCTIHIIDRASGQGTAWETFDLTTRLILHDDKFRPGAAYDRLFLTIRFRVPQQV